jgi:hypothetical protein
MEKLKQELAQHLVKMISETNGISLSDTFRAGDATRSS